MAKFGEWIEIKTRPLTEEEKKDFNQDYEYDAPECPFAFMYDCEIPDDSQEVLITTRYGIAFTTFYNDYEYGGYFEQYEDEDDVLAWMPLPERFIKEKK